jgi:catechol 2,3-dioxygenase-like lactoylglutathione lyase family enzyme
MDDHDMAAQPSSAILGSLPSFHHIGLTVADLDRSCDFYRTIVGMRPWDQDRELGLKAAPEHRPGSDSSGVSTIETSSEAFRTLTDNPEAVIRYVMLRSSDGALILQLVQYLNGAGSQLQLDHSKAGSVHMSFFVTDVDSARDAALRNPAATVRSEVIQINPSMRTFYVDDPDGVPIELLQLEP